MFVVLLLLLVAVFSDHIENNVPYHKPFEVDAKPWYAPNVILYGQKLCADINEYRAGLIPMRYNFLMNLYLREARRYDNITMNSDQLKYFKKEGFLAVGKSITNKLKRDPSMVEVSSVRFNDVMFFYLKNFTT